MSLSHWLGLLSLSVSLVVTGCSKDGAPSKPGGAAAKVYDVHGKVLAVASIYRDVENLKTRNAEGNMVPIGAVATFRNTTGPFRVPRYNLYPAAELDGAAAPGYSQGQAIAIMEKLACMPVAYRTLDKVT